jgi:hypothetical protein
MIQQRERLSGSEISSNASSEERAGAGSMAARLPSRPTSELPQPAAPDVQDALSAQLRDTAANRSDFERDPFGLQHIAAGPGGATQPATASSTNAGPELVVPKVIEFDDLEIGQRQRKESILWNIGPSEARVVESEMALDHNQYQFQARKVPDRIMPTSSSVAAKSGEIAIDFVPQAEGLRTDTLRLTVKAIDAQGAQRLYKIVLSGRAHRPGQPTHQEQTDNERAENERAKHADDDAAEEKSRVDREKRNVDDPRVAPSGRSERFHERLDAIRDDINEIDKKRTEGINVAEKEASAFTRQFPPPAPSVWDYVREGAGLALMFASYGLAKKLAGAAIPSGHGPSGPAGIGVGIARNGQVAKKKRGYPNLQRSIEKALGKGAEWAVGKPSKPAADGGDPAPSGSALSDDASVAFFASQRMALINSSHDRLGEIRRLGPELVDQLHDTREFEGLLATLDALRAELGDVAGNSAALEQSQATAAQWLSFVSKRSGETHKVKANAKDIAAGTPHAEFASDLRPLDSRDGVIEISFAADLKEPGEPVRIVGVRVLGVAKKLAERIRKMNPLEMPLPMRALARDLTFGGQRIAEPAIAVARNEGGEIAVAAGKPGELKDTNQEARYLAAKHAPERQTQQRDADVKAGGRKLLEKEVVGQWDQILTATDEITAKKTMDVETDDASTSKI